MSLRCALAIHDWTYTLYDEQGKMAATGAKFPEATHRRCKYCRQAQHRKTERRIDLAGGPCLHSKWVATGRVPLTCRCGLHNWRYWEQDGNGGRDRSPGLRGFWEASRRSCMRCPRTEKIEDFRGDYQRWVNLKCSHGDWDIVLPRAYVVTSGFGDRNEASK